MPDQLTTDEVREVGFRALLDALGPIDLVRFLQQFNRGSGDYTKERHRWLKGVTLDELISEAQRLDRQE